MSKREEMLILETATKLFRNEGFDLLWNHPRGLTHVQTLRALDGLVAALIRLDDTNSDRAADNASMLVDLAITTPLFKLMGLIDLIKECRGTTKERFSRRINQRLFRLHNVLDGEPTVDERTNAAYFAVRKQYLLELQTGSK